MDNVDLLKELLINHGMIETRSGEFISISTIGRIIPFPAKGYAVAKDKFGNKIAYLKWGSQEDDNG